MDLGTMERRLASRRYYTTLNMFVADFYRMVKNCQVGQWVAVLCGRVAACVCVCVCACAGAVVGGVLCSWGGPLPPPCPSFTHPPTPRTTTTCTQLYNGATNPYFLAAKRLYDQFWQTLRSSILPNLEAAGIVEPKLL